MMRFIRIRPGLDRICFTGALVMALIPAGRALADPPTWSVRVNAGAQDAFTDPPSFPQGGSQFSGSLGSHCVAVDGLGSIYVVGTITVEAQNGEDFLIEKYDAAGTLLWYRTLDGGAQLTDTATALVLSADAVYVTGESCKSAASPCNSDFLTAKYDAATGAELWAKLADGPDHNRDWEPVIAVDAAGTPFVAGSTRNTGSTNISDFLTIKYNPATGAETWRSLATTITSGQSQDVVGVIGVGPDGHVVVSGSGDQTLGGLVSLLTVKYDTANGAVLWSHNATSIQNVYPHAIAIDAASNPTVVGETDKFGDPKFFALKYHAGDGSLFWLKNVNYAPVGGDDAAHDVALDGGGNVYVTGRSRVAGGYTMHTVKYEASFGTELWAHDFGTGASGDDYVPTAIAFSGSNNRVVVAGYHKTAGGGRDFQTLSLNVANGNTAPVQVATDVLPSDLGVDVATDPTGNVVVVGGASSLTDRDLVVLKYSPALVETWRRSEPLLDTHDVLAGFGPPQFGRQKIAIDGLGNTVVAGSTAPAASSTDSDFLIQKYGPGGNLLWSRTIDGGAGADFATGVVLGGNGAVFVTGWSLGLGTDYDILTLRLDGATGATLWSKRFNGAANLADVSYGIALGTDRVFVAGATVANGKYNFIVLGYPLADGSLPWATSADVSGGSVAYAVAAGCRDKQFGQCIGGVYITGVAVDASGAGAGNQFFMALLDAGTGALSWGGTQSGGDAVGTAIVATGNPSTVVATGRSNGDWMTTAVFGNSATPLWTAVKDFDGRDDQAFDVALDSSGNSFVTGFATKMPARNQQAATIKYGPSGVELAVSRFGPIDEDLIGYDVATDLAGNAMVAGSRFSVSSKLHDFLFFRYDNSLGLLGFDFFDSSGADDQGSALAVERNSGDAVVAGTTYGPSASGDLLLAKYRSPERGGFYTIQPCRLYDSRNDPSGPVGGGVTRVVSALGFVGSCSFLSPAAKSLAINVTVVGATTAGSLQLYAGNIATPITSVINFTAGQARANNGVLNLATNAAGTLAIRPGLPPGGTVHVIVDVTGYFD
ncbi:MAG: hypothetical protein ABI609_11735 [Acidobacteriota bacterium]